MSMWRLVPAGLVVIAIFACRKEETRFVTPIDDLRLHIRQPTGQTCTPSAWLLGIDTAGNTDSISLVHVLVYDSSFNLHGCGSSATRCPEETRLATRAPNVRRVVLEGIDSSVTEYANRKHDVLCRAVADDIAYDSDIGEPLAGNPDEDDEYLARIIDVDLRLLAVGASNPMPLGSGYRPTATRYGAASAFPPGVGRGTVVGAGGHVPIGGGLLAEVWFFDPLSLTFRQGEDLEQGAVAGLSASWTTFGGEPGVLFAGGQTNSAGNLTFGASIARLDGSTDPSDMPLERAFHAAGSFPVNGGWVPVLMAGVGRTFGGTVTFYSPLTDSNRPHALVDNGMTFLGCSPGWCDPDGGSLMNDRRGSSGSVVAGTNLILAGGARGSAETIYNTRSHFVTTEDGAVLDDTFGAAVFGMAGTVARNTGNDLEGRALFFGGCGSATNCYAVAADSTAGRASFAMAGPTSSLNIGSLAVGRGELAATTLRDGTVLLSGGRNDLNPVGFATLERFVPSSVNPVGGDFEFVPKLSSSNCVLPGLVECAAMLGPRSGHTATRLDGTGTWLDGAVLIVGGIATSAAELFVPAYACSADTNAPVSPGTGISIEPASGYSTCDRQRQAVPVTDPQTLEPVD